MKNTTISFQPTELFNIDASFKSFVPCKKGLNDKKIPCKGAKGWEQGSIDIEALKNFPDLEMVAIVLGTEYIAIDCDGLSAIEKLNALGFDLPETLTISSKPGERQALIYKIEKPFEHFSIKTSKSDSEQLEFRTGRHYQVISGTHPKTGKPYFSNNLPVATIDKNHPINEFLQAKGKEKKAVKTVESVDNSPYLEYFLTGSDRSLIVNGVSEGGRNNNGAKLSRNLIGTENRLKELNIKFQGTALELFTDYCNRCEPVIDDSESSTIWKSALSSNPEPTLDDEELIELNALWCNDLTLEQNLEKIKTVDIQKIFEKLDAVIEQTKELNISSNKLDAAISTIFFSVFNRHATGYDKGFLDYIAKKLNEDEITTETKSIFYDSLEKIRLSQTVECNVPWSLRELSIKKDLLDFSKENGIPSEHLFTSLITACSSIIPKKVKFNFNTTGKTSSNIFTVFVGSSTSGKSLAVDPFVDPLKRLANEANTKYIADIKTEKQAMEMWKAFSKDEKVSFWQSITCKTELPLDYTPQRMFEECFPPATKGNPWVISDASMQAIAKDSGIHKHQGLLISPDEITDFLSGVDTINNSRKASALNELIKVWNNQTTLRHRVGIDAEESDYYRCSLLSTIQTKRFYNTFDIDNNEGSGICSRFNYSLIEEPIRVPSKLIDENDTVIDFSERVEKFYIKLQTALALAVDSEKGLLVRNTKESHEVWSKLRETCIEKSDAYIEVNEAFSQWLNRLPEQVARIALTIHCMRFADGVEKDIKYISRDTMMIAASYGLYMLGKASLIYKHSLAEGSEKIDQAKTFLISDFLSKASKIMQKNNSNVIKVSDFATHAFCRKKEVLKVYGAKNQNYLRKSEILTMFDDISKYGVAVFDYKTGTLTIA